MHLLSRLDRIRAHACWFAWLPLVSVPSAAVSDQDCAEWSAESYQHDLDAEPETQTGEAV